MGSEAISGSECRLARQTTQSFLKAILTDIYAWRRGY
jgi:hypothetical protein